MSRLDPARALLRLPKHGTGLGLHRMVHVLDQLPGEPAEAIKITGSNGKGSVSTMVAAILQAVGVRVGLYTSPHLQRFHERMVIDGQPIGDAELARSHAWFEGVREAYGRAHPGDEFGAFEAMTAVALHAFAAAGVDAIVAEAGIGGRYDATRVIPGSLCGLVSVDLEHTALLGSTEEQIAFDKADLCPAGGTLMVGPLAPDLQRRLEGYCRVRGVALQRIDAGAGAGARAEVCEQTLAGTTVRLQVGEWVLPRLHVPSPGAHQIDNAALAIGLALAWLGRHRLGLDLARVEVVEAIERAFAGLRLPGRLELVHADPAVVIDVGHTPAAMGHVARTLAGLLGSEKVLLVTGVSDDKDPEALLTPLVPLADRVIGTRAHHRGGEVERIEAVLARRWPELPRTMAPTIEQAIEQAVEQARGHGQTIVVAGGLFLAMEAAAVLDQLTAARDDANRGTPSNDAPTPAEAVSEAEALADAPARAPAEA